MSMMLVNPYLAGGSAPATDPYWANVILAMHMDGVDASTTFTDEKGSTFAAVGNAQISTAQSQFGGASCKLDGTGDCVKWTAGNDLRLYTDDFTFEAWVYWIGGSFPRVFAIGAVSTAGNFQVEVKSGYIVVHINGSFTSFAATVNTSTWFHVAVVRNAGSVDVFVDGTKSATGPWSRADTINNATAPVVGANNTSGTNCLNGYIDDLRLTKGVARYTSNFTPPTEAFPNS